MIDVCSCGCVVPAKTGFVPSVSLRMRLVADGVVVVGVGCVLVGLVASARLGAQSQRELCEVLTVLAAAVTAGGAVVGALGAQLLDDPRVRWVGAGLAVIALVVLPSLAHVVHEQAGGDRQEWVRLAGLVVAATFLGGAVSPPRRVSTRGLWLLAAVGGVAAFALVVAVPPPVGTVGCTGVFLCVTSAAAAGLAVDGVRRGNSAEWRTALGMGVLAVSALCRLLVPSATLVSAGLQLLGIAVAMVGFGQVVSGRVACRSRDAFIDHDALVSEVVQRERAAEVVAERDHELRNGLAGLVGITHLLSADERDEDHAQLRHAVLAELGRLHRLVDGSADEEVPAGYALAPVVDGLVALRRAAGVDVRADQVPGVAAIGDPAVLAQVLTSLLANCERHAPGARVVVSVHAAQGRAVVEVRDHGPGLPDHVEPEALFARGAADAAAGGMGLGLHISRTLIERDGGTLTLAQAAPGCLARVTVPMAPRIVAQRLADDVSLRGDHPLGPRP